MTRDILNSTTLALQACCCKLIHSDDSSKKPIYVDWCLVGGELSAYTQNVFWDSLDFDPSKN